MNRAPEHSKLLTTNELAKILNLHPATIRGNRCGDNTLGIPFIRVGKSIRYSMEDVQHVLDQNRIEA